MISINIDGVEFEFRDYDGAVEFLMACRHREENPIAEGHEHYFGFCEVDGSRYCECGKAE